MLLFRRTRQVHNDCGAPHRTRTFRCGLTPGMTPISLSRAGNSAPLVLDFWYSVSGSRMAAESICRYARRFSSVFSMPYLAKRSPIVPGPSSHAVMPLPFCGIDIGTKSLSWTRRCEKDCE
eukprot:361401-Chlamydomonas_euryale.AAC.5